MTTKQCTKCFRQLPLSSYYKNGNRLHSECKECHKIRGKETYNKKIEEINNYKANCGCKKCGERRFYLLDFHHKDNNKEFNISDKTRCKLETMMEEIKKCDVLCANCHREWHYILEHNPEANYYVWLGEMA